MYSATRVARFAQFDPGWFWTAVFCELRPNFRPPHTITCALYKDVPPELAKQNQRPRTKCRCVGYGPLPYRDAYYPQQSSDHIAYYARTRVPNPAKPFQSLRAQNGGLLLTIGEGTSRKSSSKPGRPRPDGASGISCRRERCLWQ